MNEFSLDQITKDDISSLIEISDESALSLWSYQNFLDELGRDDAIMLLARTESQKTIAFVVGRVVPGDSGPDAELYNIGVKPEFRRLGLGKKLLLAFLDRCRMSGVGAVWLEVRASNRNALSFYERSGFVAHSTRKNFYSNPQEDAIIMRSTLSNFIEKLAPNKT